MAKKRIVIGSVLTKKQTKEEVASGKAKERYIKVNYLPNQAPVTLQNGDYLNIETTKEQKESLDAAITDGKITAELGEKIMDRLNKRPEFVFAEVILTRDE